MRSMNEFSKCTINNNQNGGKCNNFPLNHVDFLPQKLLQKFTKNGAFITKFYTLK